MSNLVETITNEKEKLVLRIYHDEFASLHDWLDIDGPQIYYKHRKYRLGQHEIDPMGFGSEEELIQWLKDEKAAKTVKKLYAYEHGSITIKAGNANPFNCQWDSGQNSRHVPTRSSLLLDRIKDTRKRRGRGNRLVRWGVR